MLKRCLHYDTRTMYMYAVWHDVHVRRSLHVQVVLNMLETTHTYDEHVR